MIRRLVALAALMGTSLAVVGVMSSPASAAAHGGMDSWAWVKSSGGLQFHPFNGPDVGGTMVDSSPVAGEYLIAGDWNGDGTDTVAWVKSAGGLQYHPSDGPDVGGRVIDPSPVAGESLIAGDWDGNGTDTVAWVKSAGGLQIHSSDGPYNGGTIIDPNPVAGEYLIAGDWNGDGKDTVAWVKSAGGLQIHSPDGPYNGGTIIDPNPVAGEYLIAGDWNGDGKDTVAWVKSAGGLQYHPSDGPDAGGTVIDPSPAADETLISGNWAETQGQRIVDFAKTQLGLPYVFGAGNIYGPTGGAFDCSGLTMYAVYQATGIKLPHHAADQYRYGTNVAHQEDLLPGDLVFFTGADGTAQDPGHVGIYVGNGRMIDALGHNYPLEYDSLTVSTYVGARRLWH